LVEEARTAKNGLLVLLGGSPLHTNVDGGLSVGIRENPSIPAALTKTAKVNFSVAVLGDSDGGLREDGGLCEGDGGLRDPTAKTAIRKSTLAVLGKPQPSCGFETLPDGKAATSPVCEGSLPLEGIFAAYHARARARGC
jgi:hypothetical protein